MNLPNRKLPRLTNYDYSTPNYYFITICTQGKRNLFGSLQKLNLHGEIAEQELLAISAHFVDVKIDKYVIMPNHIHAIIVIGCTDEAERSRPFPTLSTMVGLYKAGVSKQVGTSIWQKSYHDHIIRGGQDYEEIWKYIDENPLKWEEDCFYSKL